MKKWLCFLSVLALTAGCAANPKTLEATPETSPEPTVETTPVSLSILGPTGAPALTLIAPMKAGQDVRLSTVRMCCRPRSSIRIRNMT